MFKLTSFLPWLTLISISSRTIPTVQDDKLIKEIEAWAKTLAAAGELKQFQTEWAKGDKLKREFDKCSDQSKKKMSDLVLEATRSFVNKAVEKLAKGSSSPSSAAPSQKQLDELNEARKEALRIIFDKNIYLTEAKGGFGKNNPGQAKVDEAIEKLRGIWQTVGPLVKGSGSNANTGSIASGVGELLSRWVDDGKQRVDGWVDECLKKLDVKISSDSTDAFAEHNRKVDEYNEKLRDKVDPDVFEHIKIVNDYREMLGKPRLHINLPLCRATEKHSQACEKARKIWHEGSDGSPWSRAKAEGFNGCRAENVLMGARNAQAAFNQWYNASDHHRGMVGDGYNCIGVGKAGVYWTQNFGMDKDLPAYTGKGGNSTQSNQRPSKKKTKSQ